MTDYSQLSPDRYCATLYRPPRPFPPLGLVMSDRGLCWAEFGARNRRRFLARMARRLGTMPAWSSRPDRTVRRYFDRYFAGARPGPEPALDLRRGTALQQRIWHAVRRIPSGQTRTYGAVARALGRARLARAVGQAMARNPVAPFVPCHRVVACNGLGGYGGGLVLKRRLLELEQGRQHGPAR